MCGRYGFADADKLRERYDLENEIKDLKPRYNIAPSQQVPVIVKNSHNSVKIMRWGLVPFWAKNLSIGYQMINVRRH
jgi:putative SOS response-associated peptidase YedK